MKTEIEIIELLGIDSLRNLADSIPELSSCWHDWTPAEFLRDILIEYFGGYD